MVSLMTSSSDAKAKRVAVESRRDGRSGVATDGSDHVSRTNRRVGFQSSAPRVNDPKRWNGVKDS